MEQFCPRCLHIGYGKHKRVKGSILHGGLYIGIGIILFVLSMFRAHEFSMISTLFSILFLFLGTIFIRNYFIDGNICPSCDFAKMYLIDEFKAQNLMSEHNIKIEDRATDICTHCNYKGIRRTKPSLLGSIVVLIIGIIYLLIIFIIHVIYSNILADIVVLIGSLIIIGTGIYGISTNLKKITKCPSCKNKSFIPIDSDEAKSLMKQDQTSSPDIYPEQVKSPSS